MGLAEVPGELVDSMLSFVSCSPDNEGSFYPFIVKMGGACIVKSL